MMLHPGSPIAPHDLPGAWSLEPAIVIVLGATAVLYARGLAKLRRLTTRDLSGIRLRSTFFLVGWMILALALISPLHSLGSVLFSAHMIQHEILITIAAPLLVLGRPITPFMWSIPRGIRRRAGLVLSSGPVRSSWRLISNPVSALILHAAAIWVWHAPAFYDASVTSEWVHTAQHSSFLITALLFWWSLLGGSHARQKAGIAIISLFVTAVHTSLLGVLLTVSDRPFYLSYNAVAMASWGISPLEDQQLGGIIMWVPASVVYVAAALLLLLRWISRPALVAVALTACTSGGHDAAAALTGGNPDRGHDAIRRYGCQSCHSIPGIRGARSLVGPPLSGVASRSYIGGVLVNNPDNMVAWLRDPPGAAPRTAMPNLGVTEKDARDIAAYLYTLR